jgi:hypothetical protein
LILESLKIRKLKIIFLLTNKRKPNHVLRNFRG